MTFKDVYGKIVGCKDYGATFDSLCTKLNLKKYELAVHLKYLEDRKYIILYGERYYDLMGSKEAEGYSAWTLLGNCYLSDYTTFDNYGLYSDNKLNIQIFNKKDCIGYNRVKGYVISVIDGYIFYAKEVLKIDHQELAQYKIAVYKNGFLINLHDNVKNVNRHGNLEEDVIYRYNNYKCEKIGNVYVPQMLCDAMMLYATPYYTNTILFNNFEDCENNPTIVDYEFFDKPFYTIDNISTKDVDDAIFFEKDSNGYILYVAIADATKYIESKSELDNYLSHICTSFYLPKKTKHMLSNELSTDFCSLNVGKQRSTIICQINYDENFQFIDYKFHFKDIKVKYRLSYKDVNAILNKVPMTESLVYENDEISELVNVDDTLSNSINILKDFTDIYKNIYHREEAKVYNNPIYTFDEDGSISGIKYTDEIDIAQKMVEVAMVSANNAAAKLLISKNKYRMVYRNQLPPNDADKSNFAEYSTENKGHYGLNISEYTHFTSPIRRYADMLVHRLIKDEINLDRSILTKHSITKIDRMNLQNYKGKLIEQKTYSILISQYVEKLIKNAIFDMRFKIKDINDKGIVIINSQNIECYVPNFKLTKEFLLSNKENWNIECDTNDFDMLTGLKSLKFNITKI